MASHLATPNPSSPPSLRQAAAYLAAITSLLQAQGTRTPPGLYVCRAVAADLEQRLQAYAAGQKVHLGTGLTAAAASGEALGVDGAGSVVGHALYRV